MASLAEYLRNERASMDAQKESQARALSDYIKNQQVLESLGQEDTSKKKPGLVNRLFGALGVLGRPGNLIKAGILEATGRPTPELEKVAGFGEIMSILRGKTGVTGAEVNEAFLPGLKVGKNDNLIQKIGKGAAGLATDIVTDPISYVAAPASISRKAAAETLMNVANKADFVDELAKVGGRGSNLIDELVAATPVEQAAQIQRDAVMAIESAGDIDAANKLADAAGAPLKTLEDVGTKAVAAQAAADRLSQALYTKGRTGLLKELEALTGSREAALKVFKTLPEDVRGGLVLANPITGKPFQTDGKYVRLTQGTGAGLGAAAEPLNKVRQTLGYLGNPITRNFSGQVGNILADVKAAAWEDMFPGAAKRTRAVGDDGVAKAAPRFIDYTSTKKAIAERAAKRAELQAMTASATKAARFAGEPFTGDAALDFGSHFNDAFFTPGIFDDAVGAAPVVRSEPAQAGIDAAKELREQFNAIYEEAKRAGVDIGNIGSPYEYSPLMLKESAFKRMQALGTASGESNVYKMEMGRGSHIEFEPDPDIAKTVGWSDPKNPGVVYLSPKAVNDKLAAKAMDEATAAGKTADEIAKAGEDARIYIEDPQLIIQKYGNYVANAAATKRFTEVLRSTGTLIKDVPRVRSLMEEWNTSTFAAALENIDPEVQKALREYESEVVQELKDLGVDVTPLGSIRDNMVAAAEARTLARASGDTAAVDAAEEAFSNSYLDLEDYARTATGVEKDRAELLLDLSVKLDDADFSVWTSIDDRDSIESVLSQLSKLDREDPGIDALLSNLNNIFGQMKGRIPPGALEKLTKIQREALTGEGFNRLRANLMRNEMEPGAIARGLVERGYKALSPGKANAFASLYGNSSVIEAINTIYKGQADPSSWQRLLDVYVDPLLGAWKLAATTGRGPAFVVNNVMGGMFNNWIGGVSGSDHLLALGVMRKVNKQIRLFERMHPEKTFSEVSRMAEDLIMKEYAGTVVNGKNVGELYKEFIKLGGFEQTQISAATQMALRETPTGEMAATIESFSKRNRLKRTYAEPAAGKAEEGVRKVTDFVTTNPVQAAMTDLSQQSEIYLRFAAFIDGYRKYGDLDAAMGKVKMLHFDYADLGSGEEWMRRLVPFYTWSRNNVPLQFRTILMQPGKIQKAVKAQQAMNGVFEADGDDSWLNEVMPEWVEGKGGVITKFGAGAGKIALTPNLPYMGVTDITSTQGILGMLGPQIKAPLEIIQNRNFETGAPLNKPKIDTILSNITPYYSTGRNVLTAANLPVSRLTGRNIPLAEQGKEAQRIASLAGIPALAGVQAAAVTPEAIGAELSRRGTRQYDKINSAAATLGVDTDWIRRALDKGIEPKTIAMLIQSGAGKTREALGIPAEEKRISDARRQRALDAIANMGK